MTTPYAQRERVALAETLLLAGPDAPTLCAGWTARDLAAHVVLRERRPDAAGGIVLKPLAGYTERVQRGLARLDFAALVAKVRRPAWWSPLRLGAAEEAFNLVEFFVHHEDVRRAQPDWQPRRLDEGYQRALRGRLRAMARLSARRFPAAIVMLAPGAEPVRAGRGGERLELHGEPGELMLFLLGRQRASTVEVTGPAELADRLRGARLGL